MEAIQSTRFSSFCCGMYSFLHHPNLSKTEKLNIVLSTFWKWFLCSLRYCLKCNFSKGVYSFTLSTVFVFFLFIIQLTKAKKASNTSMLIIFLFYLFSFYLLYNYVTAGTALS